ncbi:CxC2 domain-containing protein [Mycena sanguinolenta]|uniref:CxC2 domain-containing protein n=1 Tax=Mycena sanguinolenta TaxID=230812 RepID=A0A8H6ZHX4_9AGAR|nr:CxC2 domain-containing protein [Mycena sanguinolenta]
MKRQLDPNASEYTKKKRAKNVFSLKSFGHSLAQPSFARASHMSADGRRASVQPIPVHILHASTSAASASNFEDSDWLDVPDMNDAASEAEAEGGTKPPHKRKWYAPTDEPLRYWTANYRDAYLRVLVTREGPANREQDPCSCGTNSKKYRCRECHGDEMFCRECMVESHRLRPLCRIEAWNGHFFEPRELRQLGLRVQLGHPDNRACPRSHCGRNKFVVIAPNGFHHVALNYCQCRRSAAPQWEQLLLYGWFPSTPDHPKSAITIPTLKLFHAVSLQGKTTVYHFFQALAKITDNTGSRAFKRRYQLILRVVRQWRNLRALKRGDGWRDAPPEKRFLYMLFLAIDACFRLKRKKISSWAADPSLQDGEVPFERASLKARKELAAQKSALGVFSEAQKADVPTWQKAVDDFEAGVTGCKNPYELPQSGKYITSVAEETMTEYLMLGLEIEGQQRQLSADLGANRSPSTKDLADFVTRRTRISRQIKKLRVLQLKYSPAALQRLATHRGPVDPSEAERAPLLLPSSLSPTDCSPPAVVAGLAEAEARLRDAQCSESLDQIRHSLIVKKRLHTYKSLNSRHQHQNTRSRSLVDAQQRKIDLAAATYRRAREARLALVHVAGASDWKALEKADLRLPEDEEEAKRKKQRAMKGKRKKAAELNESGEVRGVPGMGEKTRLISWIWVAAGHGDGAVGRRCTLP